MDDAQKHILIYKISCILGETQERVKWDMSLEDQITKLVSVVEFLAEKLEVNLYEH